MAILETYLFKDLLCDALCPLVKLAGGTRVQSGVLRSTNLGRSLNSIRSMQLHGFCCVGQRIADAALWKNSMSTN